MKLRSGGRVESRVHKYKMGKKIKVNREEKMKESITESQATIARRGVAMRLVKRSALATLAVAAFALFAGGIADTFRPTNAETVQINGNLLGSGFVQLTDGACTAANATNQPNYDQDNNTLDVNVMPGAIGSNCLGITVTTDNSPGYTLTMSGPADGSLKLAGQSINSKGGSMSTPATFATSSNAAEWGFAIPNSQIQGMNWGFDANYAVLDRANTVNTAKYAPVPKESTPIDTVESISGTQTFNYDVFVGVSAGSNMPTGTYSGTVVFSAVGNAATPVDCANLASGFATGCTDQNITMKLPNGMIPVKYTGTDTAPEWTIMSASDIDWYDYANKQWANAITFTTAANKSLAAGTKLSASQNTAAFNDILGYWVYVPRFEYRLINTGFDGSSNCSADNPQHCPQAFDIRFVNSNTAMKNGTTPGEWLTHPGFQADLNGDGVYAGPGSNEQVDGVWVAKFEASAKSGTSTVSCTNATACNLATLTPAFVPSASSASTISTWSYIDLNNIFLNSQRVAGLHNFTIGANTGMVNTVSNSTWGAAAYLTQSLYGVCTNRYCSKDGQPITTESNGANTNANAQRVLNNGVYITSEPRGRAGCGPATNVGTPAQVDATTTTCNPYYGVIGKTASTTQNQSGIYDLAGGLWEYTFSNRSAADNATPNYGSITALSSASGWNFNKFTDVLYRNSDFLNCTSCTDWQPIKFGSFAGLSRYYGTALAETVAQNASTATALGGWGGDDSGSPNATTTPWFIRGGQAVNAAGAGVFAFGWASGATGNNIGWRAVVSGV